MDIQKEIEFFDRFEEEHQDYDVLGEGAYKRLLKLFSELVQPKAAERCIDLGCGTGAVTKRLLPFGLEITGMDIAPRFIERAKQSQTPVNYVVGDITETGLPEGSFDIVLYSGVLHHFPTRDDRLRVLREGLRILKPGGRLFAFDPYQYSPSMFLYRDPRSPLFSPHGKTENEVLLSKSDLTIELTTAGFQNLALIPASGMSFRYVEGALAQKLLPLYNVYEKFMEWSRLERLLGTFLISFAKKPD